MSLLGTFRLPPSARLKLGTLPRWTSALKFQLPSGLASRRSPELMPAGAATALLLLAAVQIAVPSSVKLPTDTAVIPKRNLEMLAPISRSYAAILAHPLFAPDRAPVTAEAQ